MTTPVDAPALAAHLLAARATRAMVVPPSQLLPAFSLSDGYEVAGLLHREAVQEGATAVGVKLGFTNPEVWPLFSLDQPFWAPVYDSTVTEDRVVALDAFVAPRIEPEIVLSFKKDLPRGASADAVVDALDWAAAGFEIVQCRYPQWAVTPADALADAGLHGALVLGQRCPASADAAAALAATTIQLHRDAELVATGSGTAALGGPVDAVAWLLRLPGITGLEAGAIVTTGTLTAAFPVAGGETWSAEPETTWALPPLSVHFT